jgi:hypothetical protein
MDALIILSLVCVWLWTRFVLAVGLIGHLTHKLWLHFINHYHTQTSVLSHGVYCFAWYRLPTVLRSRLLCPTAPILAGTFQLQLPSWTNWLPENSVAMGATPLCSLDTDRWENILSYRSSIFAWECYLAMAVILIHVHEAVALKRACFRRCSLKRLSVLASQLCLLADIPQC